MGRRRKQRDPPTRWPEERASYSRRGMHRSGHLWRWRAIVVPSTGQRLWAWVNRRGTVGAHSVCPAGFDRAWAQLQEHLFRKHGLRWR